MHHKPHYSTLLCRCGSWPAIVRPIDNYCPCPSILKVPRWHLQPSSRNLDNIRSRIHRQAQTVPRQLSPGQRNKLTFIIYIYIMVFVSDHKNRRLFCKHKRLKLLTKFSTHRQKCYRVSERVVHITRHKQDLLTDRRARYTAGTEMSRHEGWGQLVRRGWEIWWRTDW